MTDHDSINISFTCKECGGTVLHLPDDHTGSSIVSCKQCGVEFGRWGDIQREALNLAKSEVRATIGNATKGLKSIKFK